MRAKLQLLDKEVWFTKYNKKRCEVCINVSEMTRFTSNVTGNICKINHKLHCDDNCCGKKYVGEILGETDNLRYSWNSYMDNERVYAQKESFIQEHLFKLTV